MSYRQLWVLLNRLPQESWTQTALRDQEPDGDLPQMPAVAESFGPWALGNYQLAMLTDAVRGLEVTLARVNGNEWDAPTPTPTPLSQRRPRRPAGQVSYLNTLRAEGA